MTQKICIVTGTRAEYGLLYNVALQVKNDPELELQLLVTGSHLSPEHGLTVNQIVEDGFEVTKAIDIELSSSKLGVAKSLGLATSSFATAFDELKPDIVVLLGDRYEILGVAQAAMILNIPIAHIHGGEVTEGAMDEAIRHSITKMAHIHFTAAEVYRKRVIQLGESPDRVFNVGAPGLDNIKNLNLMNTDELASSLGISLNNEIFAVTFHPVTLENDSGLKELENLLGVLSTYKATSIIFTMPNADPDNDKISQRINNFVEQHANAHSFASLGQLRYLSLLNVARVTIGNSSSGIIEAPFLKTPTVNIGSRQKGRLMSASIINCTASTEEISKAINLAISEEFQSKVSTTKSVYGDGNSSTRITQKLKNCGAQKLLLKPFYDIDFAL